MNKTLSYLNGKKVPIAAITFIIMTATGYGQLKNQVANNSKAIEELKPATIGVTTQVAKIEANIDNINEKVGDVRTEQRIIRNDIKLILQHVGGQ